ncbi:MAG: hypothetical protein K9H48_16475 [Melioribacteraceae bacterium]|nr:hypothetical protein [Saprospiraceae bacterium]MCF8356048.1 hypothetical protein [Melioribacteraceae bacterium]MCF8395517.1 hypothetical protein [Melioribacteraceae bacterium]
MALHFNLAYLLLGGGLFATPLAIFIYQYRILEMKKLNKYSTIISISVIIISFFITEFLDYILYNNLIPESGKHFILTWVFDRIMPILVFFCMILGIFSGRIVEQLQKIKSIENISEVLIQTLKTSRLWIALLFSPILYYGLWLSVNTITDPVIMLVMAYQNGFFLEGLTKTLIKDNK